MALNLGAVFSALGRAGRNAYIVNGAQDVQDVPFNEIIAVSGVNPAWTAPLAQSYDSLIRSESTGMPQWVQAAQTILQGMVAAENPAYGTSLSGSLQFLLQEMQAQSYYVNPCTVTSTVAADSANVGTGVVVVTLVRADGLIFQNTIAEESTLLITSDSYTGGATVNQEPWQWSGAPNVSSLGTGVGVGLWDWDWPQGSGAGAAGQAVAATQDAGSGASQNYLTNGDFDDWDTTGTPFLNYWYLQTGTWGTSIQRDATGGIDGGECVRFNAGATLNALDQTFGSSVSDGTDAEAGTVSTLLAYTGYLGNVWLKASGVISAGVLTASLVDGSGTVINDQAGNANSVTVTLSTIGSTDWENFSFPFRLPVILPDTIRLRLKITTALAGANLFVDWATLTLPTSLYPGGPNVAVFSNPENPFEAAPDPDAFTLTFTNNRAGATYCATWQTLINRLFQTPGLLLPYTGSSLIADTLITAP